MDWFIKDALPFLLEEEALAMSAKVISDKDKEFYGAVDTKLMEPDSEFGEAVHCLCIWHKVKYDLIVY